MLLMVMHLLRNLKKGKKPSVSFDLTPTFKGQLKSALRTFTQDTDRSLLIMDEIEPNKETKLVIWQFITQAEVEITDNGAILKQDGQKLRLRNISHPELQFNIVSLDPPPHRFDKQMNNLKRIELGIPVSKSQIQPFGIVVQLISD
jgi:hypothetical protein